MYIGLDSILFKLIWKSEFFPEYMEAVVILLIYDQTSRIPISLLSYFPHSSHSLYANILHLHPWVLMWTFKRKAGGFLLNKNKQIETTKERISMNSTSDAVWHMFLMSPALPTSWQTNLHGCLWPMTAVIFCIKTVLKETLSSAETCIWLLLFSFSPISQQQGFTDW